MALEWPSNPTNGQVFDDYFYDASIGAWRGIGSPNNLGVQVGQLRTASPITVANQAGRDALYPAPVEGNKVFRDDLGVTQTYYAAFNASTNPGGRDVAGWYDTEKTAGLVPVRPSSVTAVSGSATVNALGVVTVSGATSIALDGVFSSNFRNYYISINANQNSGQYNWLQTRLRTAGTSITSSSYQNSIRRMEGTSFIATEGSAQGWSLLFVCGDIPGANSARMNIQSPNTSTITNWTLEAHSSFATPIIYNRAITSGSFNGTNTFDGIMFAPQGGSINGTFQVFGYNDK